jgi:hypothetical protein
LTKDCGVHPKVPNRAIYTGIFRKIIGFRGPSKASRYLYMLRKAVLREGRDVRYCQVEAGAAPACAGAGAAVYCGALLAAIGGGGSHLRTRL